MPLPAALKGQPGAAGQAGLDGAWTGLSAVFRERRQPWGHPSCCGSRGQRRCKSMGEELSKVCWRPPKERERLQADVMRQVMADASAAEGGKAIGCRQSTHKNKAGILQHAGTSYKPAIQDWVDWGWFGHLESLLLCKAAGIKQRSMPPITAACRAFRHRGLGPRRPPAAAAQEWVAPRRLLARWRRLPPLLSAAPPKRSSGLAPAPIVRIRMWTVRAAGRGQSGK